MKHFYSQIKKFLNIALFLGIFLQSYLSNSQTTLVAGDILFTGYDTSPASAQGDTFSFVCLKTLDPGTTIRFTDRGYGADTSWWPASGLEGTVTWVTSGTIPAGTEVFVQGLNTFTYNKTTSSLVSNSTLTLNNGTMSNGLTLNGPGDQIYAFQGGTGDPSNSGVVFIAGIHFYVCPSGTTTATWDTGCTLGTNTSTLKTGVGGLVGGTSAFYTGPLGGTGTTVAVSGRFDNTLNYPLSTVAEIRAAVLNQANWGLTNATQTLPSTKPFLSTPTAITTNPASRVVCSGSTTSFTVVATGATNYQWQVNTGSGFVDVANVAPYSGANTATLTITGATSAMNSYQYRCVVGGSGSVTSTAATLTVPVLLASAVQSQSNVSTYGGTNGSATIVVSNGVSPYFYSWSPSGATSATATNLAAGTYTVTITDSTPNGLGGCTISQTVTITQPAGSVVSTNTLSGFTSCGAASPEQSFTLQAGGLTAGLTVSAPTGFEIATSSTGPYSNNIIFNPTAGVVALRTVYVRLAASATGTPSGNITISSTGITTQNVAVSGTANGVTITSQPAAVSVCDGGNTSFSVTASNATGYQWQVNQGTGFVNITNNSTYSGATTNILNITGATTSFNGYLYRVVISGTCPSVNSNNAALTINPTPSITTQPITSPICAGSNTSLNVIASNATGYIWQVNDGSGYTDITNNSTYSGATTATLNITAASAAMNNYTYRAVVSGGCTPNAISNAVTLTVNSAPAITSNPSDSSICNNSNTTFTATASNATAYQWQVNQGAGFSNITNAGVYSGANTATLVITGATAGLNNYQYRVVASGNCLPTAISTAATLRVSNIQATTAQTDIACHGTATGSLVVSPTGGIGSYTYEWSNGATTSAITNLAAGNYSVTIKDAVLCERVLNFTIVEPTSLTATAGTVNNVSCHGGANGTATVNVNGGTPGYTYSWAPSGGTSATASGLAAGDYTVTITDANACQTTQSFTITQPAAAITLTPSQTNVLCRGAATGSASVTVTGGTSGYTYSWAPYGGTAATATGLAAGTFTVTVTDANTCQATQSFTITEPAMALTATAGPTLNVKCKGDSTGSATVIVTGGTGAYTYSWAPSGGTAATASGLVAGTYTVTVTDANSCTTTQSFTITEPANALTATAGTVNNVSCNGGSNGSATVNVTGGTGARTYSWAPYGGTSATASGLAAGNYVVTVTDTNNCQTTQSFTITQPSALDVSGFQTDVSCNGGSNGTATVAVSGGTGSYTYQWSPSGGTAATASGLQAGTYTVTVRDANNCQKTQSFTITEPISLTATQSQTNVLCNGSATGTATVTASGGSGSYSYLWSPSGGTAATATGLTVGNYSVLITDNNGCSITKNFTITQPSVLTATTTQVSATCSTPGEAGVIPAGGTTPYTYLWSDGQTTATATGLLAGNYSVMVTDSNGCIISRNFTITTTNTLVATTSQTNVLCNGQNTGSASVVPSGAAGPFTYAWSPSGGTADTATGLAAGNYSVTITAANGCSIVKNFTITQPTAINITPSQTNITCNGGSNGSATVSVTGGTGSYTYLWAPSGGTAATATGLAAGTYTVTVTDANLCQKTQSFTITQPAPMVTTVTQTNVSCNAGSNGSATVSVTGGTGVYTYSWAPFGGTAATATGLSAGTYTVTITDANGCIATQSVTITEPLVLTASSVTTDVTCNGANDGTATVSATGGTGTYTYSWAPSGGTAATATGLAPGTYTATVTDANGCFTTQTVTILTTPDVTAPVPSVAVLPEITEYCSVLASQIPVPTAVDNCVGLLNGTTTDPLNYNTPGTYTITWKYDDGNGNTTTQLQTVKVLVSPINAVTFSNATFTYDGNPHSIQVANLPTGATVTYSSNNGSINAGTYAVTATVTPASSLPNCSPIVLTANLVINKAAQQITFGAIPTKTLGANNTFNLTATASSGLPVTYSYTYDSALPPATVTPAGQVTMTRSGEVLITAHQPGNNNYLPATDVSQLLVILNNNIDVKRILIGSTVYENPAKTITKLLACGETNPNISVVNESNATITPAANFTIQTPKPGIYTQNVNITSEDGSLSANYLITVEKPFGFYDIVQVKFNNVLIVNNNPQTNGGYEFTAYQWFKNGQLIGTGQYYSAGESIGNVLDPTASYMVKMTTKDGKVLQTCSAQITLTQTLQAKLYPNPIQSGKIITVEADFPSEELEKMQISLYSVTGQLVKTVHSSSVRTEIQLPETTESNMYLVVLETPNVKKSFKVIVK
ncbi:T9SS type A sorting domain-containing protein [Flavobacterium foetidum]|uniref:T9SS type A sorting domain-containing protein n=1 Tax=Flavobacterium foetidum TaxID=2026681 RepID=UPI001074B4E4|nr:T9SS type A sorting domain-containing protein [Flavobacterium foetidum]KAF2514954.1 T9SS type A sorting domain-containing protein [Flavobacterium foetidum]